MTGYANAGQVCISSQRDRYTGGACDCWMPCAEVQQLVAGDPLAEGTQVGPLIRERDAARVETWLGGSDAGCGTVVE